MGGYGYGLAAGTTWVHPADPAEKRFRYGRVRENAREEPSLFRRPTPSHPPSRLPLGRAAAIHRLGIPATPALADVRWTGRDTTALVTAIDAWDVPAIDAELGS